MQSEPQRARLQNVLRAWRDDLIDLSGRNRLLNFRPTRTATLEIRYPGAGALLDGLTAGWVFADLPDDDSEDEGLILRSDAAGVVTQKTTQSALDSSLRKLYRDSNQVFNDTGLWILQLGAGFLKWREPGAEEFNSSPLLLVPVRLERRGPGDYRLVAEDGEDAAPNPALAVKMDQLGLVWPAADDMKDLPGTIDLVRKAVRARPDWEVTEDVVLALFQSHKESMYRDLLNNEDHILEHPLVRAIGLGAEAGLPDDVLDFDPVDPSRIDELQPPEDTPFVLDADSSQRQCVAAALEGRSFVMDGPPGTGKSQTIANMIGALMHAGRSVLFVSEKAAALDVVRNRLDSVGLDTFLFPLHSHHTSRKEVAQQLGAALQRRPKAVGGGSEEDRRQLKRTRKKLSAYAEAMNEVRPPLGRDLHAVLGRLDALSDVPELPMNLPDGFGTASFQEVLAAADAAGDSWRPAAEGTAFAWHGLNGNGSPQARLQMFVDRSESLHRRLLAHADLAGPLGLTEPGTTERLLSLLDAAAQRPAVPSNWLTAPDLAPIRTEVEAFIEHREHLKGLISAVGSKVAPGWERLPRGLAGTVSESPVTAPNPDELPLSKLTETQARPLAKEFEDTAVMLEGDAATLADIAAIYGMPDPGNTEEALALCTLTAFAGLPDRPEAAWLDPQERSAAVFALGELHARSAAYAQARAAAGDLFTEKIFDVPDFPAMVQRFHETHGLGRLSADHRAAKRLLATLTVTGEWTKAAAERLPQALAWHQAAQGLRWAVQTHGGALGRYWRGEQTDFRLVHDLLGTAEQVAGLTSAATDRAALIRQVTADGAPDLRLGETAEQIRSRLDRWRATLVPVPRPGGRPRLAQVRLTDAAAWYTAQVAPLEAAADLIAAVQPACIPGTVLTLAHARDVIGQVTAVRTEQEAFHARRAADRDLLGDLYAGLDTDSESLRRALEWTASMRAEHGAFPESSAHALLKSKEDDELRAAHGAFRAAATDFAQLFDAPRGNELFDRLTGTFDELKELTERLKADTSGPDEWRSFQEAREVLRRHGLGDLIERAAERGLAGTGFRDAAERAVLEAWAEDVLARDSRLKPGRAVERDKLVAEFRELDAALVAGAHARVIEACNARRPRPNIGQAAGLQREAQKKSRHKPVRALLDDASEVIRLLKPCMLMSPLAVSRFLPPSYRFDVVIFDEASQVLPQDAINCVYRGRSLIVAGDQKQLPPTDFFAGSEAREDDEYDEDAPDSFESLLDLCKASGLMKSLSLRWHYRSRHEGLIAFSNRRFYGDELVTFPGARESGEDVGVTFTKVAGVYERGRSRSNPVEARAVAERVLHHYSTRPHLSLGVVAMSGAQAQAIEDAVEDARAGRPDLDRFFSVDRLHGFFVKNLETVQGDERDVILLSVGYGPDQDGKLTMAFGPLIRKNGWRRLNVAVTRARHRVEVLSSISGGNIRESENNSRNQFKRYLDYAELGPVSLEQGPISDDAEPESPFEESVLKVLLDWGYDVQPQAGVGGYRIDLAVRHPHAPGRFALGIECDGAMYHSSKAARDRDRLREEVLRGLGWELHRIWGTDWYRNRTDAERRLREAVEAATVQPSPEPEELEFEYITAVPPEEPEPPRVTFEADEADGERGWGAPYRRARLTSEDPPYEIWEAESGPLVRLLFRQVVDAEAPIQADVLYRRVADVWFAERVGPRMRAALDGILDDFVRDNADVERRGDTIATRGQSPVARRPGDGVERKIGEVPPEERRLALRGIVGESPGITEDGLTAETARFFGWGRRGPDISRALSEDLADLAAEGAIEGVPGRIVLR